MKINKTFNLMFVLLAILLVNFVSVSATSKTIELEDYSVEYSYTNAIAGKYMNLVVNLTNYNSKTVNLTLDIDDGNPFTIRGSNEWKVELSKEESATKTFSIKIDEDADSKKYSLDFNLDDGPDDWDDEFEIKITSNLADLELGEINSLPKKILPGSKDVALSITIKNAGDVLAEDIIANLSLPEGFTPTGSYSTIVHAGDLAGGNTKIITFYFDVEDNLDKVLNTAELILDYQSDGEDETKKIEINLPVFSIPQFEITNIEILSGSIYSGQKAKIKLGIKNIGGENAKDVSLKVYERSDQPFEFVEKSSYIGSLDIGQMGYAIFEFNTDSTATPSRYLLNFQVRSVNGEDVIVDDLTYGIDVKKKEFHLSNYILYILGGIVGLFILITQIRKRRK